MNLKKARKSARGFTLIELLVVIAIIGILSSIVLASLNTARGRGSNAAVKANLSNIRVSAEIYYDSNNSYGSAAYALAACPNPGGDPLTTLFRDTNVNAAIHAAVGASGQSVTASKCIALGTPASTWAISVPLRTAEAGNAHWCVDSTGASKGIANALTSTTVAACPSS